jgi:tetratricopeptide (TPR) repeat protein
VDGSTAQEAFDAFMAASRIRPKDPVPPTEAGLLALDLGDRSTAARMLQHVYGIAPTSGAFHFLRGCVLKMGDQYRDAIEEFRAAKEGTFRPTQAADQFFECTIGLGLQLVEANRFDDAVKILLEGVALKPNHSFVCRALYNLGLAYRRLQTVKESEKYLRLCIQRFPNYAPAYGELGDLLADLDRFDEAVEILEMSVKVDPTYRRGWLLLGSGLTARGRFKEADRAFREYEERFPPTADSEYYRGVYYQKKMEPEKAVEHLQRSLAIDPKAKIRAHYYLALCYRDLGRLDEAEKCMKQWTEADKETKRQNLEHLEQANEKVGPKEEPKDGGKEPKDRPADPPPGGK